jgi:hypothetical protein
MPTHGEHRAAVALQRVMVAAAVATQPACYLAHELPPPPDGGVVALDGGSMEHDAELDATVDAGLDASDPCEAWTASIAADYEAMRTCATGGECGQPMNAIELSCGCTRAPVARTDADVAGFLARLRAPPRPDCPWPKTVGGAGPCDCPPTDGFICVAGRCEWSYTYGD